MRYVSTRGEAAPLDFVEVMLTGLARDGGLYVPESWPRLGTADIAAFAGRPYAEIAADVIGRFTGGTIADADLARMAQEAYGTFRHPATAPMTQLNPGLLVLELFHGPDSRLQGFGDAARGAPDGPRAPSARRTHHHRRGDVRR